jgi:O-antigen ligase
VKVTGSTFPISIFTGFLVVGALLVGMVIGMFNPLYVFLAAGALVLGFFYLIRLDEFIVVLVIIAHIMIDSYLGYATYQLALLMALILLLVCYLGRSADHPWTEPRWFWLWFVFLVLTIVPLFEGGDFSLSNSFGYYLEVVFSALVLFWIGNIIAKDVAAMRRVFQLLALMATLFAIHTLIQATTGVFLFETAKAREELQAYATYFQLGGGTSRASSFFGNPNGNGIFLAVCVFLPLGLFVEGKGFWKKAFYLLETLTVLAALACTYSTGSWAATVGGLVLFIVLAGRIKYSVLIVAALLLMAGMVVVLFPDQIAVQLSHSSDTSDTSLHLGGWETAIRVAEAYPLFGVGLGDEAYLVRAEPYRVAAQTKPLAEPDNSFLQWGAIAGIPTMVVFLVLLGLIFWAAWRNWLAADPRSRALFAGGTAAILALSINSLTVDGWTSPVDIQFLGWLIAGVVASPLVTQHLSSWRDTGPAEKKVETDARVMLAYPE